MLPCREIVKILDLYLDGELEERMRARVEEHLKCCSTCRELLNHRIQEAAKIRAGFPVPELAPGFTKKVMEKICSARQSPQLFPPLFSALGKILVKPWLAPVLAVFLVLAFLYGTAFDLLSPLHRGITTPHKAAEESVKRKNQQPLETTSPAPEVPQDGKLQEPPPGAKLPLFSKESAATTPQHKSLQGNTPRSKQIEGSRGMRKVPEKGEILFGPGGPEPEPEPLNPGIPKSAGELKIPFAPTYLPAGFVFESLSFSPGSKGGGAEPGSEKQEIEREAPAAQESLLISYVNSDTGAWIRLEIIPAGSFEYQEGVDTLFPAAERARHEAGGESKIAWYAQKEDRRFLLVLSGTVPYQELKKVADSIH
ncbi:MAG: hypothetical protein HPY58_12400 [Firmicutes bacterium]|nr:hypothetical protein [Bacillota bacterium]